MGLYQLKWRWIKITGLLLFPEDQNCPKKPTLSREFPSLLVREGFSKVHEKPVATGTCNSAMFQLLRNLHSIFMRFCFNHRPSLQESNTTVHSISHQLHTLNLFRWLSGTVSLSGQLQQLPMTSLEDHLISKEGKKAPNNKIIT